MTVLLSGVLALLVASASASAAAPRSFFGIVPQAQLPLEEGDFNKMGNANVGTLRLGINWPALQRSKNANNRIRHNFDDEFGAAAAEGIDILPFINNSPKWVSNDEDVPPIKSKEDKEAWKNFLRLLVERYGPGGEYWASPAFTTEFPGATPRPIEVWQIWNEPSSPASWEPFPNAKDYGKLVKMSEKAIHERDPQADIMLAGIFYSPSNNGPRAPEFTRKLLDEPGVKSAIDSAAVHAYGKNADEVGFQIKAVREALDDNGAQDVELFVTETGWSTGKPRGTEEDLFTSLEGQAKKLKETFQLAVDKRNKWNLGGIFWYSLVDLPRGTDTPCLFCPNTGLFTANRKAKPAWEAFQKFTHP